VPEVVELLLSPTLSTPSVTRKVEDATAGLSRGQRMSGIARDPLVTAQSEKSAITIEPYERQIAESALNWVSAGGRFQPRRRPIRCGSP
jgi:hypothetical protein